MGEKKKILVIDDNVEIVRLLASFLKDHGYEVVTACDGQTGIDKVAIEMPDLVIADLAMPKITGNVLVRIVKSSKKYSQIPVIMLSAFVDESMKEGVEIPADAYVTKPFDEEEFLALVRQLIESTPPCFDEASRN